MKARRNGTPRWQPLPTGVFSGIDWAAPGALDDAWPGGADPYFVWAEATGFAHGADGMPHEILLLIELAAHTTAGDLQAAAGSSLRVNPAYLAWPSEALGFAFGFCTAHARPAFFEQLRRDQTLSGRIRRMEAGLVVASAPQAWPSPQAWPLPQSTAAKDLRTAAPVKGPVMAVIDDGFAVAHARLQDAQGHTRVAGLWVQDGQPLAGDGLSALGYGRVVQAAQVDAAMQAHKRGHHVDEVAVYRTLGLADLVRRHEGASHGTHVSDLACGRGVNDEAAHVPMIAVQLPRGVVEDASGGALHPYLLDALVHVLLSCANDAQIVVNISFGELGGAHNGTSILDKAIDALNIATDDRLRVVVAAGNAYQARAHAQGALRKTQTQQLGWRLPPDDPTPTFLEWWVPLPEDLKGEVSLTLTLPDGAALPALRPGDAGVWRNAQGLPLAVAVFAPRTCMAEQATCLLLALAPTCATPNQTHTTAQLLPGRALLTLHGELQGRAVFWNAWIERESWGNGLRARSAVASYFEDAPTLDYGQQYDPEARTDDPTRATLIRREGSFNGLATALHVTSVGGTRADSDRPAIYSPTSSRSGSGVLRRKERSGIRTSPTRNAASDDNAATAGRLAAGLYSGSVVRLVGTSSAAPQVARAMLVRRARESGE